MKRIVARGLCNPAFLIGIGLALVAFNRRLPASTAFLIKKIPLLPLITSWVQFKQTIFGGVFLDLVAYGILSIGLGMLLISSIRTYQRSRVSSLRKAALAAGFILVGYLTQSSAAISMDLVQNVWFSPEGTNLIELMSTALLLTLIAFLGIRSCASLWEMMANMATPRRAALKFLPVLGLSLGLLIFSRTVSDTNFISMEQAVRIEPLRARGTWIVLRSDKEKPVAEMRTPSLIAVDQDATMKIEEYLKSKRLSIFAAFARRAIYMSHAANFNAAAMRRSLYEAQKKGDVAARLWLLENLAIAEISDENVGYLKIFCDEGKYHAGEMASWAIASAWDNFSQPGLAREWRGRVWERPLGLLGTQPAELGHAGGTISAKVTGILPSVVGLFRRRDLGEPYDPSPAQLVDGRKLEDGNFIFSNLAAGNYYLVLAFETTLNPEVRVFGSIGDIRVTSVKPNVVLPVLSVR